MKSSVLSLDDVIAEFAIYLKKNRYLIVTKNTRTITVDGLLDFDFFDTGKVGVLLRKAVTTLTLDMHLADLNFFSKALQVASLVRSRPFSARYSRLDNQIKEIVK